MRLLGAASDEASMVTIFISHVDTDRELALALARELEGLGYSTWYYERDSLPGVKYVVSTHNAITRCEVFLLLISDKSMASNQVQVELERAHETSKNIIPILHGVTDVEYKRKNVSWKQMIGASTSCPVTPDTVREVAERIARGLAQTSDELEQPPAATQPSFPHENHEDPRTQGIAAARRAKFEAAMEEGDRLLEAGEWCAAEAAYRRGMAVPGFGDAKAARDGMEAAQASAKEERRIAEEKRIAEELRLAEEKRLAEKKRIAEEKRATEAKRLADEKRIAEEKRATEAKRLADAKRVVQEKRLAEKKRAAAAKRQAAAKRIADAKRIAEGKRLADENRRRRYLAAVGAAGEAFKKQDFATAARETQAALVLCPDDAEALALAELLQPTLEVRSHVDGQDTPGAVIGFSGKASEYKTPTLFKFESGKTYEVSVSLPAADGRVYTQAEKTFVADWFGPQVWTARLDAPKLEEPKTIRLSRITPESPTLLEERKTIRVSRITPESPTLRVPAGCRAAEGAAAEPYSKSGWAQEIVHAATGMALRFIPPGTFTMGSPAGEAGRGDDEVQHLVTLTQGFYLGKYPVTQAQWEKTMGATPSSFKGADLPVETVSWDDCQAFLKKFGAGARLPTEAEWEYACRAVTTGAFAGELGQMAWYSENSGSKTHPVGLKQPNAWGLHDMHGNVWEWCSDWYGAYPTGETTDPKGAQSGSSRVSRGGCWNYVASGCRSAYRIYFTPSLAFYGFGFRVVLAAPVQ